MRILSGWVQSTEQGLDICRVTGLDLSPTLVYDYPTLGGIVEAISQQLPDPLLYDAQIPSADVLKSADQAAQFGKTVGGRCLGLDCAPLSCRGNLYFLQIMASMSLVLPY